MENLVGQLRAQHEELRTAVHAVAAMTEGELLPGDSIVLALESFRTQLSRHLSIEDTTFYPLLLQRMEQEHIDTTATKLFIGQMVDIGVRVYGFLDAYQTADAVTADAATFRTRFQEVANALAGRMAAEDKAVYALYERLTEQGLAPGSSEM